MGIALTISAICLLVVLADGIWLYICAFAYERQKKLEARENNKYYTPDR